MRSWRYAVPAVLMLGVAFAGVVACSVGGGTIDELGPGATDSSIASDSSPISDAGVSTKDSAVANDDSGEHPVPDAACGAAFSSGSVIAYPSAKTKTIDGNDSDWGCEVPFDLTGANAQQEHSNSPDAGYDMSGACKFEWSPIDVYVFCDVVDPTPGDGTSSDLTSNDAVEVYISGTPIGSRSGNYGSFDHQYVVDWRGHTTEYANGTQLAGTPTAFNAAVVTHAGGYSIEASIADTALLSGSSLGPSMTLGFDFAIDNGVGQQEAIIWAQGTHAGCGACTIATCCCGGDNGPMTMDYVYCDALAMGSMTLHP